MRKSFALLAGLGLLFGVSSCNNGGGEKTYTQEELDSIAQFRADSIAQAQQAYNDSLIQARAADSARIADSIAAATATTPAAKKASGTNAKTPAKTPTETTTPTNKIQPGKATIGTPQKVNNLTKKRTPADIEADKKAARFGDKAAQERLKADEAAQKAARFGDDKAKEQVKKVEDQKKADRFNK